MSYKIVHHAQVESDILAITGYLASYAGLHVAKKKVDEITAFIDTLAYFPKIGSIRSEIMADLRAVPAGDNAVVCFIVNDQTMTVTIMYVSYAGSDWAARLKDRL
ncbi:MAG: type II toxin-antitoxin system RelE/ParE family toxin [Neorhizobium sp.]|nr:type II toxin-antitoxin system RelE/ParE family toxin [Neorhizobium sp.]